MEEVLDWITEKGTKEKQTMINFDFQRQTRNLPKVTTRPLFNPPSLIDRYIQLQKNQTSYESPIDQANPATT